MEKIKLYQTKTGTLLFKVKDGFDNQWTIVHNPMYDYIKFPGGKSYEETYEIVPDTEEWVSSYPSEEENNDGRK